MCQDGRWTVVARDGSKIPMGKDGKSHSADMTHLRKVHRIAGQEPGNVRARCQVDKSYKSEEDLHNHMPQKGFGAGIYEEEDNAQHEGGEHEVVRTFARAQNPSARGVTPALGCNPRAQPL